MAPPTPAPRTPPPVRHDVDDDVEVLATQLAQETDADRRAVLVERIVLAAIPLADSIAKRYSGRGIETDDLVQVARTALVKAVHRYRPDHGSGFAAFAGPRSPARSSVVPRPGLGRAPSPAHPGAAGQRRHGGGEDAARAVPRPRGRRARGGARGHPRRRRRGADVLGRLPRGLARRPRRSRHERRRTPARVRGPADAIDVRDALYRALALLTDRQRLVLRLRFVDELTQSQIGRLIGVSQMQVSRILHAVLDVLRTQLFADDVAPVWPRAA